MPNRKDFTDWSGKALAEKAKHALNIRIQTFRFKNIFTYFLAINKLDALQATNIIRELVYRNNNISVNCYIARSIDRLKQDTQNMSTGWKFSL